MATTASPATTLLVNPDASELGRTNAVLWGRGSRGHHVREFPGPLSLKTVLRGRGVWETDEGRHVVDERSWLVLNEAHPYSLTIERGRPVETFCVFFARGYVPCAKAALLRDESVLADDPGAGVPHAFRETKHAQGGPLTSALLALRSALERGDDALAVEERLMQLTRALVGAEQDLDRAASRLSALRASTRDELLRRLLRARAHAEDALGDPLSLDRLAREAAMSPFHFHRAFSRAFSETPAAFVRRRRLERAREALLASDKPVTEICLEAGFASLGSFSTLFRSRFGVSPSAARRRRS